MRHPTPFGKYEIKPIWMLPTKPNPMLKAWVSFRGRPENWWWVSTKGDGVFIFCGALDKVHPAFYVEAPHR